MKTQSDEMPKSIDLEIGSSEDEKEEQNTASGYWSQWQDLSTDQKFYLLMFIWFILSWPLLTFAPNSTITTIVFASMPVILFLGIPLAALILFPLTCLVEAIVSIVEKSE